MRNGDQEGAWVPGPELANLEVFRRQAEGAAHTLNNAFTSLLGELALLGDERKDDPVVDEAICALREQLERCVKLVRNGLVRPAMREPSDGEVDLGLLISRCIRVLEGTLPRRVMLTTRVPDESWLLRGEAAEIEVTLLSLLFRMGDLVPGGCVDVRISVAEGSAAGTVALHVDVEAPDLPADARQRLVDPGLAEDATRAASLQAIHAIADRHGSHLQTDRTGIDGLRVTLEFDRIES
ncbi:MAG: HAMP domain-containing histidine kinase [Deltaproteobacteria bacterium]|nr:HAMP domain-containing histidine kinase [Deltaproteobacteria bacterium]MBW2447166.1 HAMP domain-containing histidine kinase [Deltaproteobacteria bacterium]